MRVYERIREYVATHGLEPQTVAVWAGLSRAAFAAMLEGRRRMYAEDVRVICLALEAHLNTYRLESSFSRRDA